MLGLLSLWEQEQWNSLYAHEHSAGGTFSKTRAEQRSWFLPSFVCELRSFSQIEMSVYKQRVSNVKKEKAQLDVFNEIW